MLCTTWFHAISSIKEKRHYILHRHAYARLPNQVTQHSGGDILDSAGGKRPSELRKEW